jgi:hypothetical protein
MFASDRYGVFVVTLGLVVAVVGQKVPVVLDSVSEARSPAALGLSNVRRVICWGVPGVVGPQQ